jgi:hypothetical protein
VIEIDEEPPVAPQDNESNDDERIQQDGLALTLLNRTLLLRSWIHSCRR